MDNIRERIKKLFALANDKGASEDEASTAMRMAMGLMAKHGIAQDELGDDVPEAKEGSRIHAKFEKYQITLAGAAATLYGCRVIAYNMGKQGIIFVGREDNIDAAQATLFFLTQQVEELYKKALPRGMTQRDRSEYRKTFKWACSLRVEVRAHKLMEELKTSNTLALGTTGSTALVVQNHFDKLFQEADEVMETLDVINLVLKPKIGTGSQDGARAGEKVKLRKEVETRNSAHKED